MKLLSRTSGIYMIIAVIVMAVGGFVFFHLIDGIFYRQIDETLLEEKLLVEEAINYSDTVPDFRPIFGHNIDVTILNAPHPKTERLIDTVMYHTDQGDFETFRHLFVENTSVKGKGYILNLYKPLKEKETLVAEIMIVMSLVFISLLATLVFFNYFISRRVWVPFYRTLQKLAHYDINQGKPLELGMSAIHEFNLLNMALESMSQKIRQDFLNLKEFNENASHELQTPLAVIKSKLDLLVQGENLSEDQMQQLSSMYEATTRMSKLNQGLLLISKIENNQFTASETVSFGPLVDSILDHFGEMTDHKGINVSRDYAGTFETRINKILAEILVNNLLSNSIKHNKPGGKISIHIDSRAVTISNTGGNLNVDPPELFERFKKSDQQTDSVGLGLSIVRKIASLNGLTIDYSYSEGLHSLTLSKV